MNSTLFVFHETFTNGYQSGVLDLLSLICILSGILVIVSKNPVVSVLFLIGLFISISCYLIILGLNFIGLSYLLVYVGAVSILFLFILMLINVRISELSSETSNSLPLLIFGLVLGLSFPADNLSPLNGSLDGISNKNLDSNIINIEDITPKDIDLSYVTSKTWDGTLSETSHITTIGNILYSSHSIWLILTSIILLLAMVGAIVITIKQKN
jgi:NADH-ubiquinone oxidoreductase chain 6